MSVLDTLTEGIRARSLANEGEALLKKWERTGLLEGLGDVDQSNMARLLENQAAQLLKETSSMAGGDVAGFASVAFPIVRRVFGNLLAQDLVSVQPMSLPSGLIFFLDFTFSGDTGMDDENRLAQVKNTSLYGGGVVGQQLTGGVNLAGNDGQLSSYALNNGFSSPTGSSAIVNTVIHSGTWQGSADITNPDVAGYSNALYEQLRSDPSLISGTSTYAVVSFPAAGPVGEQADDSDLTAWTLSGTDMGYGNLDGGLGFHARRLTQYSGTARVNILSIGLSPNGEIPFKQLTEMMRASGTTIEFPIDDQFVNSNALGGISGSTVWGLENTAQIPSIDIKVDSVAVTADTKKLKAKWTPELAQDLNAYHNLDAEVELTSILSEQIALEIDQEILADLVQNATASTLWWSRLPGRFVNRETGRSLTGTVFPDFTGTVSEWYETLLETVNDVSARIHRKTLRGGANFLVCSPEVAALLEFTSGFRATAAVDEDRGSWGVKQVGSISRKMEIYVDPYFLRNVILVGRKGSSFLESGYVYAPYVPLQVTPTLFDPDSFVPTKGVMTRYAKKMVRPDMYGLVIVADLVGGQN